MVGLWVTLSIDIVVGFASLPCPRGGLPRRPQATHLMVVPPANLGATHRKPTTFKHLFRHYDDISMDCWLRCAEPVAFLKSCGYTTEDIEKLSNKLPALLTKDVHAQLAPHVRFLVKALGGGTGDLMWAPGEEAILNIEDGEECVISDNQIDAAAQQHVLRVSDLGKKAVPVSFFNVRLEKTLAPWHAYLCWQQGLPCGPVLLQDEGAKFRDLLDVCESSNLNDFVKLCNSWETTDKQHTADEISEFEYAFHEGLVPAVRNHIHAYTDCESGQMVELLLSHGANHLEDDHYGASLLHWAAGTGNIRAVRALLEAKKDDGIPSEEAITTDHIAKDGATALHWAAAGVTPQGIFGTDGHAEICRCLLDKAGKKLTRETTYASDAPLAWAAWAGSLDVVKLLVEDYGADPHHCSDGGTVAHWACAGGNLSVCHYLADSCGLDFSAPNVSHGMTPMDWASSEGHHKVVEWLSKRFYPGFEAARAEEEEDVHDQEALFQEVAKALKNDVKQSACDPP